MFDDESRSKFLANCHREFYRLGELGRPRRLRPMGVFAEEEIVIPDGPFAGMPYRIARQPYAGLWFDAIDSWGFRVHEATGPIQSGKTLTCAIIPLCWHLFEKCETVIFGVPDMNMAGDKWREDIEPVIGASRYRDLIPTKGGGSRGGSIEAIRFRNGATLRFMSGGGGDKARAGFTAAALVVTETDGMDMAGGGSREADKIAQLLGRLRASGHNARAYLECTASIATGHIWREYWGSTRSRIVLGCPHCNAGVVPEQQHLHGWKDTASQLEAIAETRWNCPACGVVWEEEDRQKAHESARLVHGGVEDCPLHESREAVGTAKWSVVSDSIDAIPKVQEGHFLTEKKSYTLGFRWGAVNNMFLDAGYLGGDMWKGEHALDQENARKELSQFVFALPYVPPVEDAEALHVESMVTRFSVARRGIVPTDADFITVGVDIGKHRLHWVVLAFRNVDRFLEHGEGGQICVVDYGIQDTAVKSLGVRKGIVTGLLALDELMEEGFPLGGEAHDTRRLLLNDDKRVRPLLGLVDARWMPEAVTDFGKLCAGRWKPSEGFGATAEVGKVKHYTHPKKRGKTVPFIGQGCHVEINGETRRDVVKVDADYWKTEIHRSLSLPPSQAYSMTFYAGERTEHMQYCRHLTAEKKVEEFVAGKGVVTRWVRERKENHWLDATELARVAGNLCGFWTTVAAAAKAAARPARTGPARGGEMGRGFTTPDGRNFLATQR